MGKTRSTVHWHGESLVNVGKCRHAKGAAASRAAATAIAAKFEREREAFEETRVMNRILTNDEATWDFIFSCTSTLFYFQCKFLHKPHSSCSAVFPIPQRRLSRLGHAFPRRAWTNPVIAEMTRCRPEALTRDSMSHTDASLTLIEFCLPNYSISNRPER